MIDTKHLFLIFAILSLIVSCSVKEDRDECPCLLSLDFSLAEGKDALELSIYEDSVLFLNTSFNPLSLQYGQLQLEVPRGNVTLSVSDVFSEDGNGNVLRPYGSQFARQSLYVGRYDTRVENHTDTVVLHKNHCMLRLEFLDIDTVRPYTLKVTGNVSGSKWDGSPHMGSFCVELPPSDKGTPPVCIPRQKDGSLRLDIMDNENMLRSFALGEYILASGYDWKETDLRDLDVTIDFARYRIVLKTDLWEKTLYFHIEI